MRWLKIKKQTKNKIKDPKNCSHTLHYPSSTWCKLCQWDMGRRKQETTAYMWHGGTWPEDSEDTFLRERSAGEEEHRAYPYWTMLVPGSLKLPVTATLAPAPSPCSASGHAEQTQEGCSCFKKEAAWSKLQWCKADWLCELTIYLGSTLLWTRLCLLGGAICTRAGEKERDIENMETNVRGNSWGERWIMIKLNRANKVWTSQVTALKNSHKQHR